MLVSINTFHIIDKEAKEDDMGFSCRWWFL